MLYISNDCLYLAEELHKRSICTSPLAKRRKDQPALLTDKEFHSMKGIKGPIILISNDDPWRYYKNPRIIDVISHAWDRTEAVFRVKKAIETLRNKKRVSKYKGSILKKEEELKTIHAFEENIKTTFILEELLKMIVDVITRVLGCKRASVLLLQGEGRDVLVKGTIGADSKRVENFQVKYRGRVTKEIIRRKSSLLLKDVSKLDWLQADSERTGSYITSSFLSVPILVDSEVSAIINVTDKTNGAPFDDTDRRLLEIISSQVSGTIQRFNMSHELLEKERMTKELQVAREIQINLLPNQNPSIAGLEAAFFYQPAHSVGGDYFDFFELENNLSSFLVGDVSGKGVPASLLMVMVRSVVRYAAQKKFLHSSDVIFNELNDYLLNNSASHMFMTLFMGVVDTEKNILSYTNAGHNYPLVLHKDRTFSELKTGNLILGMFEQTVYRMFEEPFNKDDLLIMYTDGIIDAADTKDNLFTESRVRSFFSENYRHDVPLMDTISDFKKYFLHFSDTENPRDDSTLILVRQKR